MNQMSAEQTNRIATPAELIGLGKGGHISQQAVERGFSLIGQRPGTGQWRHFLEMLLLGVGALLLVSGIVFFFAYNWADLSRFAKLGLVQGAIVLAVGIAHWQGFDRWAGKIALTVAALLVGALLAVVGQEYQTGADAYTLFLYWALLIAGWVLFGKFDVLWCLWLGLINLTILLWWQQTAVDDRFPLPELVFGFNALALFAWEWVRSQGAGWMQQRWLPRLLTLVTFVWILFPTLRVILGFFDNYFDNYIAIAPIHRIAPFLYLLFLTAILSLYRRRLPDLFMLTMAMLSLIIVLTTLIGRSISEMDETLAFFATSLAVIIQAAVAVAWLRGVQQRMGTATDRRS